MGSTCSKSSKKADDQIAIPAQFSIMFGQGGGFTGRWSGYTIEADGTLLKWDGRYAEDGAKPIAQLTPEQMGSLWQCVNDHNFFDRIREEYGNQTAIMRVTAEADTHRVSWKPVVRESKYPLTPLDSLYFQVHELIAETLKKQKD